jgi:hypothetical protein
LYIVSSFNIVLFESEAKKKMPEAGFEPATFRL